MRTEIKELFATYERLFNKLDVKGQAKYFADHFISAGPRGSIAMSKEEFLKMAHKAADFYKSVGQTSSKILSLKEIPISNEYVMVTVHWGSTFQKTGDKVIEYDVSYLLDLTGKEPMIILFISHEDEEKAMKELGLLE